MLSGNKRYLFKNQNSDYTDEKDIESLVSRLRLNLFISQTEYIHLHSLSSHFREARVNRM